MDLGLEGTLALVAGSSRGIGEAIARAFLRERARVVLTGRDEQSLERLTGELSRQYGDANVVGCRVDLADESSAAELVDEVERDVGPIESLVLNAGTGRGRTGWELSEGDWQELFAANLWTGVRTARAALPHMVSRGRGAVVVVSSIAGIESIGAPLPYAAAKAALGSWAGGLAREVGSHGVRVNCVAPGNVLFPGGSWEEKLHTDPERWERFVQREVSLGRFASVDEIATPVVFLCSAAASFVTGTTLVIDGGQTRSS